MVKLVVNSLKLVVNSLVKLLVVPLSKSSCLWGVGSRHGQAYGVTSSPLTWCMTINNHHSTTILSHHWIIRTTGVSWIEEQVIVLFVDTSLNYHQPQLASLVAALVVPKNWWMAGNHLFPLCFLPMETTLPLLTYQASSILTTHDWPVPAKCIKV